MFHSVVSGFTIWTSYEVITMWAFANNLIPFLSWEASPFWFIVLFLVIPIFRDAHFYLVHRLLHFKFLYKHVHSLHHKNIDIGPWSGLAMHPIEHLYYYSCIGPSLVILASPFAFMWNGVHLLISPAASHSGWEDHFQADQYHYLHHRSHLNNDHQI